MIKFITVLITIVTLTINVLAEQWPQCSDKYYYPGYLCSIFGCNGNAAQVCKGGNAFAPTITVTFENCVFGSCPSYSCTLDVLSAECCTLAGGYRFCARPALAGDYTNNTNVMLDYTTFPRGDPRYGALNPRSQMCGFDDPCDLKDVCTMPGSPGNMPCHYHRSPSECQDYLTKVYSEINSNNNVAPAGLQVGTVYVSNQGMEAATIAATSAIIYLLVAGNLLDIIIGPILGPILALMILLPWVNEEVSHAIGCVDWPQSPYPPPFPVTINASNVPMQSPFAENICKTGEFPTCDNLCVNSSTQPSSFVSPSFRVGYREEYVACATSSSSCTNALCNHNDNCAFICNASHILTSTANGDNSVGHYVSELPECSYSNMSGERYDVESSTVSGDPCVCLPTTVTSPPSGSPVRLVLGAGAGIGISEGGVTTNCADLMSCAVQIVSVDVGNYEDIALTFGSPTSNKVNTTSVTVTDPLSNKSGKIYLGPSYSGYVSSAAAKDQCAPDADSNVTLSNSLNQICAYSVQSCPTGQTCNCSNNNQQIACFSRPAMSLPLLRLDNSYNYYVDCSDSDISVISTTNNTNYSPQVQVTITDSDHNTSASTEITLGQAYPKGSVAWLYGWQLGLIAYDNYGRSTNDVYNTRTSTIDNLCGYYDNSGNYVGGLEYSSNSSSAQYIRGASKVCLTNLNSQQNSLVSLAPLIATNACYGWCPSRGGSCYHSLPGTSCNSSCCDSSGHCCNSNKEYCNNGTCTSCAGTGGVCTDCGLTFDLCAIPNSDGTQLVINSSTGDITINQGTCSTWSVRGGVSTCATTNADKTTTVTQYEPNPIIAPSTSPTPFGLNLIITTSCGQCGACTSGTGKNAGQVTCNSNVNGRQVTSNYQNTNGLAFVDYTPSSSTSLLGVTEESAVVVTPFDHCSAVGSNLPALPHICNTIYQPPSGAGTSCPASFNSAKASLRPLTGLEMGLCVDVPAISQTCNNNVCTVDRPPITPPTCHVSPLPTVSFNSNCLTNALGNTVCSTKTPNITPAPTCVAQPGFTPTPSCLPNTYCAGSTMPQ